MVTSPIVKPAPAYQWAAVRHRQMALISNFHFFNQSGEEYKWLNQSHAGTSSWETFFPFIFCSVLHCMIKMGIRYDVHSSNDYPVLFLYWFIFSWKKLNFLKSVSVYECETLIHTITACDNIPCIWYSTSCNLYSSILSFPPHYWRKKNKGSLSLPGYCDWSLSVL